MAAYIRTEEALMVSILKGVGVLLCGLLLSLGLSKAVQAEEIGGIRVESKTIKGELSRVEYGDYFVKEKDGKEVRLHTDKSTQMVGQLRKGDRVEAKVTDQNYALSIRAIP
jgi:hypothetical protein